VAISGLPPLNGLVSELLIYLALFRASDEQWLVSVLAAPALALTGGLAVACFVKVVGVVFLGVARAPEAARAHEAGRRMLGPMAVLVLACVFVGVGAPALAPALDRAVAAWAPGLEAPALRGIAPLSEVALTSAALLGVLGAAGFALAARGRARRGAPDVGTWDCGYAAPSARMQYSSSSFADGLVHLFGWALRPATRAPRVEGPFPTPGHFHSHTPDAVLDLGVTPVFRTLGRVFARLRPLQRGSVHLYLLYILATLLALLLFGR
jgi:hydrogenase-4 component B